MAVSIEAPQPNSIQPAAPQAPRRRPLAETLSNGQRVAIMIAVMAATLMEVLDTSIVNVAMPQMMGNLGATLDQIGWVSTGYIISNVIVLPLTGWLSDYFGRRRYLTYSVILFTIASFGCGISHTLIELILWRIVQGAGGAAFLSTAQATLIEIFPPNRRGLAQAMFSIGVIAAPTLGPTLGGIITDTFSWPWIFYINIPVGIVAAILTMLYVPDSPAAGARRSADFVGIGFLALGLGSLQTVLERGESEDWFATPYIVALAITSLIGIGLFIWWELRPQNPNPAVNLHVVRNRNLAAGTVYAFCLGFILYGVIFVIPQFLQNVQGHTAEQTGLILMPGGLASAMMMPIVGMLSNRIDKRLLIGIGMIVFIASTFQFSSRFTMDMPDMAFYAPLMLRGAGIGLQFVPLSLLAFGTLPPRQVADGAGFYNLFRQLGGSFGIAILATLVDRRMRFHSGRLSEHVTAYQPMVTNRVNTLQRLFMSKGMGPVQAHTAALRSISHAISGQAAVLTYIDVFRVMSYVSIFALFLILLFQKPQSRVKPGPAH